MQKLKNLPLLQNKKGSILVGVIVFSLVMAIASLAYMTLSGNTVTHETVALDDEKAYQTAESGLLVGIRWLREISNWELVKTIEDTTLIYGPADINNMTVTVSVINDENDPFTVLSEVTGGTLTYTKSLKFGSKLGNIGNFINNIDPNSGPGGGGLDNVLFDGPVHSNSSITLSSTSHTGSNVGVLFKDAVTVTKAANNSDFGGYGDGTSNNYDYGVFHHNISEGSDGGSKLDDHFISSYAVIPDKIEMDGLVGDTNHLPEHAFNDSTAFIVFMDSSSAPRPYYGLFVYDKNDGTGTRIDTLASYPLTETRENWHNGEGNDSIFESKNHIGVLGEVTGRRTLSTIPGKDILVRGDLKYKGFELEYPRSNYDNLINSNNYGIGDIDANGNIIALFSGGDIVINGFEQEFSADSTLKNISNTPSKDEFILTASLIAKELDRGIILSDHRTVLYAIGDRYLDKWNNYLPKSKDIHFCYDSRLGRIRAPGIPEIEADPPVDSDGLRILVGSWSEKNGKSE
jgi:hypothetical protein